MREVKRDPWCRHRTAFDDKIKVCKAGVDYHQFRTPSPPDSNARKYGVNSFFGDGMPCLGASDEAKARCSQFSGWTAEENAERERASGASFDRVRLAIMAIREATKNVRGMAGKIPCPTCSKPLHYSVARVNGHIHARCETANCVSFMQ